MMETNVVTGWRRKMRVRVDPGSTVSSVSNQQIPPPPSFEIGSIPSIPSNPVSLPSATSRGFENERQRQWEWQWEWHSDKRGWTAYHNKLCRKMESALRAGMSRYVFKIRSTRTQYELDFESMTQRNLDTLKMRAIRRRARLPSTSHSAHSSPHRLSLLSPSSMVSPSPSETPMAETLDLPPPPPPPPPVTVPLLKGRASMNGDVLNLNPMLNERRERKLSRICTVTDTRFVWEYRCGDGRWRRYGDGVSLQFESVFQSEAMTARLKIGGVDFEVAVREQPMVQINCVTGSRSEIRRVVMGRHRGATSMSMEREREHALSSLNGPKASRSHRKRASMMCLPSSSSTASSSGRRRKKKAKERRHRSGNLTKSMVHQPGAGGMGLKLLNIEQVEVGQLERERESMDIDDDGISLPFSAEIDLEEEVGAKLKRRRAPKSRSLTVDLSANGLADDVLDRVVKRQQNAMRHFKRRHSQRRSLAMSLCGDGVSLFDAVQEEEEKKESEDAVIGMAVDGVTVDIDAVNENGSGWSDSGYRC